MYTCLSHLSFDYSWQYGCSTPVSIPLNLRNDPHYSNILKDVHINGRLDPVSFNIDIEILQTDHNTWHQDQKTYKEARENYFHLISHSVVDSAVNSPG